MTLSRDILATLARCNTDYEATVAVGDMTSEDAKAVKQELGIYYEHGGLANEAKRRYQADPNSSNTVTYDLGF